MLRRWLLAHWFTFILALVVALWVITATAYYLGFSGLRFRNRFTGQDAVIDFMRKYDRPVVELGPDVGLELDQRGTGLHAAIVRLEDAPFFLCWVCGRKQLHGGIAMVDYRQGDWLYRAPEDLSTNSEATRGRRRESREYIRTVAYNRATGERLIGEIDVASQARLLAEKGLAPTDATRLSPAALADLAPASMMREGCMVFNLAYIAVLLLWLVIAGPLALLARRRRRRSAIPATTTSSHASPSRVL